MFKDIKIIFMGTPAFSVPALEMLIKECNVIAVVTQPDKIVGRKRELQASPVKVTALYNNIKLFQPIKIREEIEEICKLKPDLIITCAYGQILPKDILNIPQLGAINIHASILPKYRGAAPIAWSLINGETKTGITLMYMDEGLDTGDIIVQEKIDILANDNQETLYQKLSILGSNLLKANLENIILQKNNKIKQNNDESSYARMLNREDELLNFTEEGLTILNKVRGLYPNAYIKINNEEIKILQVRFEKKLNTCPNKILILDKNNFGIGTKDGIIYLEIVKPFSKKIMDIKSYLNGIQKDKLINTFIGG